MRTEGDELKTDPEFRWRHLGVLAVVMVVAVFASCC